MALATDENKKNKDISLVKCYQCGHMGHYASKCPKKKKGKMEKDLAATAAIEDFAASSSKNFPWSILTLV